MNAVLALDTSTDYCSVAFVDNDVSRSVSESLPRAHNQHILAMVDEVLGDSALKDGVDVIACGVGPGSFTGLRVAVGVAQGLAWSLDLPIWPFCSLRAQALSDAARNESNYVLSLIDAQIGQVYGAWFQWRGDDLHCISEPAIERSAPPCVGLGRSSTTKQSPFGCRHRPGRWSAPDTGCQQPA